MGDSIVVNTIRYIKVETQEQFQSVLAWARAQKGHEGFEFTPGAQIWAACRGDEIVAAFQLATVPVLTGVFGDALHAGETARIGECVLAAMDMGNTFPVIACHRDSPLVPYLDRLYKCVWEEQNFYKR